MALMSPKDDAALLPLQQCTYNQGYRELCVLGVQMKERPKVNVIDPPDEV